MTEAIRGKSITRAVLELLLIAAGVFLGLAGDQWRDNAAHRQRATASLQRFREEIAANRASVAQYVEYHKEALGRLEKYLATDHRKRNTDDVRLNGIRVTVFEHAAWDLAVSDQSLADVPPEIALSLSKLYNQQQGISELSRGFVQAMYVNPPNENFDSFAGGLHILFSDLVAMEPPLLQSYDDVLRRLDARLGARRSTNQ